MLERLVSGVPSRVWGRSAYLDPRRPSLRLPINFLLVLPSPSTSPIHHVDILSLILPPPSAMTPRPALHLGRQLQLRLQLQFQSAIKNQRRFITSKPPPFPTVPTCPSPTCGCAEMPPMPDGLAIDHKSPLNGVMAGYAEHVLVCTGQDDWMSRIEEESSGDNLAADLKELFGRGGIYSDVSSVFEVWFVS